jgi:surfactin synthase thioesterase subunit
MRHVVEQVVAEIEERGLTRVLLWGHSTGSALAMETAGELLERGVSVDRVFLGAQLLGDAAGRRAAVAELAGRGDSEIAAWLSGRGGYTELGELDPHRAEQIGAAYRHDVLSAHRWFLDALEAPPALKLSAPVTAVVAADDPSAAGFQSRHLDWQLLAARVDLHELAGGGHYFLRTRPTEAADVVRRATRPLATRPLALS